MKKLKELKQDKDNGYKLYATSAKVDLNDELMKSDVKEALRIQIDNATKEIKKDYKVVWGPQYNVVGESLLCQVLVKKIAHRNGKK